MSQLAPEQERKYILNLPVCLLCILHELGHHFTQITEEEYDEYLDEVDIINEQLKICETQKDKDEITLRYRNLFLEKSADIWVVNFVIKNKKLVKSWCNFGKNIIKEF